jgi:septum formation protein
MMKKIILASGSPRRKMLLEWAEIPFEIMVSDADESFSPEKDPLDVALEIARNKNIAIANSEGLDRSGSIIISADTIVVLDQKVIGKPVNRDDAISILSKLSGRTHKVITAVCISSENDECLFHEETEVDFHPLTSSQIEHYVDTYKPYDKAGAYAIQEWIGVIGIKQIKGDFYNVMGLPVSSVIRTLNQRFLPNV